jgi:hypothetical protein
MKKETPIAIFLGIFLGALLAVFIITKNREKQLEKTKTIAPSITITPKHTNQVTTEQSFEITSPSDGDIVSKNTITIAGKSVKGSTIIIQSPIKEIVQKNEAGSFSIDFPLAFGENTIQITIYNKEVQSKAQEKTIKIYYLDEQL